MFFTKESDLYFLTANKPGLMFLISKETSLVKVLLIEAKSRKTYPKIYISAQPPEGDGSNLKLLYLHLIPS